MDLEIERMCNKYYQVNSLVGFGIVWDLSFTRLHMAHRRDSLIPSKSCCKSEEIRLNSRLQAAFDAHFVQDLIVEAGEGLMHSGQQLLQASLAMCSHAHKKRQLTMLFSGEPFKRTFFLQLKALAIVFQVGFVVV